jgi:hypothetical protein
MKQRLIDRLKIGADVMIWENGDVTLTVEERDDIDAIITELMPFWALKYKSPPPPTDEYNYGTMLFLELQERNK